MYFFFTDMTSTHLYTLSLHDALPICPRQIAKIWWGGVIYLLIAYGAAAVLIGGYCLHACVDLRGSAESLAEARSEEHTSELQSRFELVCRILLEKKNGFRGQSQFYTW